MRRGAVWALKEVRHPPAQLLGLGTHENHLQNLAEKVNPETKMPFANRNVQNLAIKIVALQMWRAANKTTCQQKTTQIIKGNVDRGNMVRNITIQVLNWMKVQKMQVICVGGCIDDCIGQGEIRATLHVFLVHYTDNLILAIFMFSHPDLCSP